MWKKAGKKGKIMEIQHNYFLFSLRNVQGSFSESFKPKALKLTLQDQK